MARRIGDLVVAALVAAITVTAIESVRRADAVQNELVPPVSGGPYTGIQFSQLLGDGFRSLASLNKGSSPPANVSGAVADGLPWLDDSSSPWALKYHADGNWVTSGYVDDVNGRWVGVVGGGTASLASAATTELGSVAAANVTITGTTAITSFGSTAPVGVMKVVRFEGALTLTHSGAINVPGGYSMTTAAADRAIVTHLGSGAWEVTQYTRASGIPVDVSAVGTFRQGPTAAAPELHVLAYGQALSRATYPAYLAKVTRGQTVTRISGGAQVVACCDVTAIGPGMPIEGTGIPAGTTITAVAGAVITMSQNATSTGSATATVFLTGYGSGGSSSTVGAPDCRGVFLAGLDNTGGSAASRITVFDGTQVGVMGGSQTVALTQGNVPNYTLPSTLGIGSLTGNVSFNSTAYVTDTVVQADSGANNNLSNMQRANNLTALTAAFTFTGGTITGSVPSGGSGTPVVRMPPTLMTQCAVRVTP